jgi:hypothetical protein
MRRKRSFEKRKIGMRGEQSEQGGRGQTMTTPVSLFLGALAPMPPPVATGPGMLRATVRQGYGRWGNGWGKDR